MKRKISKSLDKPRKIKAPGLEVRQLIKKHNIKGEVDIVTEKNWFSEAMENLDKKEQ